MSEPLSLLGGHLETYRNETVGTKAEPRIEPTKRFKPIDRNLVLLRPLAVEKLVEEDHSVRAIWAMLNRLDLRGLERNVRAVEGRAGQSGFDPRMLMGLWIYAISQGISSARELSRLCEYEPGCQWMTGLQGVNYHTLADFRVEHKETLDEIFVQVLGVLSAEGLVELTRIMQDGTKVKAQAGSDSFRREERIRQHLELAREQVKAMDNPESEESSQRVKRARQRAIREKKERLELALRELQELQSARPATEADQVRASETDPQARVMKQSDGGFAPSYNVQISTEASHGIIVAVDVVQAGTDYDQLLEGIERVETNTGQAPVQAVVDGGYIKNTNIEAMAERGVDLIGPVAENNPEASLKRRGIGAEFYPDKFQYDSATDTFTCPMGKTLTFQSRQLREGRTEYSYSALETECSACPFQPQCCARRSHRRVVRKEYSEAVKAFREKMQTDQAKQIYSTRAQVAEFPNAWIKEKLGLRRFRLRGLKKARIEALWACLTYNIQQWKRLCWMGTHELAA